MLADIVKFKRTCKKAIRSVLFLIILFFTFCNVYSQRLSRQGTMYIDSLLNHNYAWNEPGAVALVAINGKPVFRRAYGLANVELHAQNRPEYVFPIGSITKQFTAVLMLQLAQEGMISLQDDIRKYLPWYNTHQRTITIDHLLSHTSGIISYSEKEGFITKMMIHYSKYDIVQFFMHDSLLFEPGTDWSYSNSGYFLAGMIIEEVTGMPLNGYLKQKIFEPLGMNNTYIGTHQALIPRLVTGYSLLGINQYKQAAYFSWTWLFSVADIISNVDDLLKWDEALYGDKLLQKEWLEKAWSSYILSNGQSTNYGYGFTAGEYKGLSLITHGGGVKGFVSYAVRIPSQHIFVLILSNKAVVEPVSLAYHIAFLIAGQPLTNNSIIDNADLNLYDYVGVYEMRRVGSRMARNYSNRQMYRYVTTHDGMLFSQTTGDSQFILWPVSRDAFAIRNSRTVLHFNRDSQDQVVSLELSNEPLNFGPVQFETKTDRPLPEERTSITLDPEILGRYVGNYDFGDGDFVVVVVEGNQIYIEYTGRAKEELLAESEFRFFLKTADITFEFTMNEHGMVNGLIMNQFSRYEAKKID